MNLVARIAKLVNLDDKLSAEDLACFDHFHPQGARATKELMQRLHIHPGSKVLDIGCGIAGPARYMVNYFNLKVLGIDLNKEFLAAGQYLNERTGFSNKIELRQEDILDANFNGERFDGVFALHSLMNIERKQELIAKVYDILKPNGFFAQTLFYKKSDEEIQYPVPWADTGQHSFLEDKDVTLNQLEQCGLSKVVERDVTQSYVKSYTAALERLKSDHAVLLGLELMMPNNAQKCFENTLDMLNKGVIGAMENIAYKV